MTDLDDLLRDDPGLTDRADRVIRESAYCEHCDEPALRGVRHCRDCMLDAIEMYWYVLSK